jgi:hypothetical protein
MSEPDGTEQPRHLARTRAGKAARTERQNLRRRKEQQRDRHERAGKSDLKPA